MGIDETHPELSAEYDLERNAPLTPENISSNYRGKVHWVCRTISETPCGHRWEAPVRDRARTGSRPPSGCPFCSGRAVHTDGRNSMSNTHPELAEEFDLESNAPITPDNIKAGTGKKLHWICLTIAKNPCEYRWEATGDSRKNGSGCPVCANKVIHTDGRNSMEKTHPVLTEEFDLDRNAPLTPRDIIPGSDTKWHWICRSISETPCGHRWKATANQRTGISPTGCPVCSGYSDAIHEDGRNSMRVTHPELAEEFDTVRNAPITPDDILAGTNRILYWVCRTISETPCGNRWPASGDKRSSRGQGCPACSPGGGPNAIHEDGRNSMEQTHPELAEEFDLEKNLPTTPRSVRAYTHQKLHWICRTISETPCGHRWEAIAKNRARNGDGCPACSNHVVHEDGRNSMRKTHPNLAEEFDMERNAPLTPDNVLAGTNKKLHWVCRKLSKNPCGRKWKASSNSRINPLLTAGCSNCSKHGYNFTEPGWYYVNQVLTPEGFIHCFKGGKSNDGVEQRYRKQRSSLSKVKGYESFEYKKVEKIRADGQFIHDLEEKLKGIKEIRFPSIEGMDGKKELFRVNPLEYARKNGLLDDWELIDHE